MSKPWKPGKKAVELQPAVRPSRIRRDPVRVEQKAQARPISPEQEMWLGVTGIVLFAAAIAAVTVGIAATIYSAADPPAKAGQFDQCVYDGGDHCVLDGDTIYVGGEKVEIAGIEAPEIQAARCPQESERGIYAAVRLAELLNGGKVTMSGTFRDNYGRDVRKVQVKGRDVGVAMISAGLAREYGSGQRGWCGTRS